MAFQCRFGHFEYKVMPFELTNALASFQALINDTLRLCVDRFACAYLDNIIIYSKTLRKHKLHVQEILKRLQSRGLFVQKEKCEFHKEFIEFLGFVIGRGFIQTDPKKVEYIASWPIFTFLKHFQAFLGFANFYWQFIRTIANKCWG